MSERDERLWHLAQRTRLLQELRDSARPAWRDEAAREMDLRYLNPHQESAAEALTALDRQAERQRGARRCLERAAARAVTVARTDDAVHGLLAESRREAAAARQIEETASQRVSAATARLPEVEEALARAAAICEGVPTS